jgi:hypothetical protein
MLLGLSGHQTWLAPSTSPIRRSGLLAHGQNYTALKIWYPILLRQNPNCPRLCPRPRRPGPRARRPARAARGDAIAEAWDRRDAALAGYREQLSAPAGSRHRAADPAARAPHTRPRPRPRLREADRPAGPRRRPPAPRPGRPAVTALPVPPPRRTRSPWTAGPPDNIGGPAVVTQHLDDLAVLVGIADGAAVNADLVAGVPSMTPPPRR